MKYIYKITNIKNGKVYIGQTKYRDMRFKQHLDELKRGKHYNYRLQHDFDTFGEDCFKYEILQVVSDDKAYLSEDYWIDYYGGIDNVNVYNMQKQHYKSSEYKARKSVAYSGNHPNPHKGMTHVEMYGAETAEKMRKINSEKHKGKSNVVPYQGKVKMLNGEFIIVTPDLMHQIKHLKFDMRLTYVEIQTLTGIGESGLFNICKDRIKLLESVTTNPDECKDVG